MKTVRLAKKQRSARKEFTKKHTTATKRDFMFEGLNRLPRAFKLAERIEEDADELLLFCDNMDKDDIKFLMELSDKIRTFINHDLHGSSRRILSEYKKLK